MPEPIRCSVIVLTMGDRPSELQRLIESLGDPACFEGILVGNGVQPADFEGWLGVESAENLGVSGGRDLGAGHATGDLLVFIDDDCTNRCPGLFDVLAAAFDGNAALGAVAMKVVVEGTNESLRQWQPRVFGRDPDRGGAVTSFHGAAHAVRSRAYARAGGYHRDFFYAHEETDLAWRLLDDRWIIDYRPELTLEHPRTQPSRHSEHLWYSARNRVWLARRNLPAPLAAGYAGTWFLIQLARARSLEAVRQIVAGSSAGMRNLAGERRPIAWSTAWRMTRLGRPPLI